MIETNAVSRKARTWSQESNPPVDAREKAVKAVEEIGMEAGRLKAGAEKLAPLTR